MWPQFLWKQGGLIREGLLYMLSYSIVACSTGLHTTAFHTLRLYWNLLLWYTIASLLRIHVLQLVAWSAYYGTSGAGQELSYVKMLLRVSIWRMGHTHKRLSEGIRPFSFASGHLSGPVALLVPIHSGSNLNQWISLHTTTLHSDADRMFHSRKAWEWIEWTMFCSRCLSQQCSDRWCCITGRQSPMEYSPTNLTAHLLE